MEDVGALDDIFACQGIYRDFRDGGAIGEIIERVAAAGGAVPMDLRRLVEPGGRQLHPVEIGGLDEGVEGDDLVADLYPVGQELDPVAIDLPLPCGEFDQPFLDLAAGVIGRHAV
ncbi:hypothetical protein D3C73_1113990 [compost metagenome]